MNLNLKNGSVTLGKHTMDYVRFGSGPRNLILLPGLGDGLRTVRGTALAMAALYHRFAATHTVYVFSRVRGLPAGCSTRDMARDQALAMDALSLRRADVVGVSMGGMIAQHLAADYPEKVDRLVLVVTAPESNPTMTQAIESWTRLARAGAGKQLMESNVRLIYTPAYYAKARWMIPFTSLAMPKSYDRFLIQAQACLDHNATPVLGKILSPTLVLGGRKDRVLGWEPSVKLSQAIPNATLRLYRDYGHGLYEEAPGFQSTVLDFLG